MIADTEEIKKAVQDLKKGNFNQGLPFNINHLDQHFRIKLGNFVIINGLDNVGKSTVIWYLTLLSAMFHGHKWLIFSSENSTGYIARKYLEFYYFKRFKELNELEINKGLDFFNSHFRLFKTEEPYTVSELLKEALEYNSKHKIDGLMIDPYNSLELETSKTLNTHELNYKAVNEIKRFTKKGIMVWLNCHAPTEAARKFDKSGFPLAPQKSEVEGGVKFANKADDFITIHRIVQSKDLYKQSEIHIRKIKECETGGQVTPFANPVILEMVNACGFICEGVNPIENYWLGIKNNQINMPINVPF